MLWIGKAVDPFTEDLSTWQIEAPDYYSAKAKFKDILEAKNPFFAHACESWIEPAEDQPDDEKCYLIQAGNLPTLYHWYASTYEEAVEQADYAAKCYDFVEILYGWPGHWQPVDVPERSE